MGFGKPKQIKMIKNCYSRKKMRGRALWKLIETKWKWPKKVPGKKSKWRGVSWHARKKKWRVVYLIKEVTYHVGYYGDERAAAEAYDDAVHAAGLTNRLNFPKRRPKRAPRKKPASSKGAAKKKKSSSKRRR